MQNLRQPVAKVLLNSIDAYKVGLYGDTINDKKVLSFKEYGINIPGDIYTGSGIPAASGTLMTGFSGSKSCTQPGEIAFEWVEFNPPCPCGVCGWEYGISITSKTQYPHKGYDETTRSYSGLTETINCTLGAIDDVYVLAAETDMIIQIAGDTGHSGSNTDPMWSRSMSPVEARRVYDISETIATVGANILITLDGILYTITTDVTAILTCSVINGTATLKNKVLAFAIQGDDGTGAYRVGIMSRNNGDIFTITVAGSAVINHRYIALNSKDVNMQFSVGYTNDMGGVTSKHTLAFLNLATAAGGKTTIINAVMSGITYSTAAANDGVDTTAVYATNLDVQIDLVAAMDADVASSWDDVANMTMVYGSPNVSKITFTFSATSTTVVDHQWSGSGSYPILTGADVARIFINAGQAGEFARYNYLDQVNPDDEYCMYDLNFNRDIYAIHGASHTDHYLEEVQIYIKKSLLPTLVFDANISTGSGLPDPSNYNINPDLNAAVIGVPFTPDTTFEQLLTIWAGVAPAAW